MKKSMLVVLAGAFAALCSAAQADDGLSANVSLVSKYKFRGQDQSDVTKQAVPALQGGFDYALGGFYVGNWNSAVGFAHGTEMDLYGGYKGKVSVLDYDVGILQYYYPQKDKSIDFNTTEIYGALTWTFLTFKYSHTVSNDYFGLGKGQRLIAEANGGSLSGSRGQNTGYFELNANYPIDKLTINGHVGYTKLAKKLRDASVDDGAGGTIDLGLKSYYDYKIGVTYDLSAVAGSGVSVAAAYVGANKKDFYGDINKGRVILTLSKAM
jgi:uncharacterized protein (TIGR02001 family)